MKRRKYTHEDYVRAFGEQYVPSEWSLHKFSNMWGGKRVCLMSVRGGGLRVRSISETEFYKRLREARSRRWFISVREWRDELEGMRK